MGTKTTRGAEMNSKKSIAAIMRAAGQGFALSNKPLASGSPAGDLEEWTGILETLVGPPSRPPSDTVWFGIPQAREFLAALRSHRCNGERVAELEAEVERYKSALRSHTCCPSPTPRSDHR